MSSSYGGLNYRNLSRKNVPQLSICWLVKDLILASLYSSSIRGSVHALRELRIQCGGHPYRILYAFDPQRNALLILGGDKTGNDRWYEENVPRAERIYEQYLKEIEEESK